ncbi:hypothetical protein [Brachyspira sp.]|nr:hypothetical protein [Brachyspira sp.]
MIIDLKKYSLIDFQQIKTNIETIIDMNFDIIVINETAYLVMCLVKR